MTNVPELRFDGFDGEWEEIQLGIEADVRDGTHDSPKYINKGYPLITSKNVVNGKLDFEDISFISEEDFYLINKRSKVDIGDIIMPMIGTIGNPIILNRDDFAIKNVALIKKSNNLNNQFLLNLLKSKAFYRYLHRENAGGTQKFIALRVIREFLFNSPTIEEQEKIGDLFKKIDYLIENQEGKVAKMEDFKKSMAQKMFPKKDELVPELRFDGFDGKWEEKVVGDLLDYEQPTKYIVSSEEYYETGIPVLTANKSFILGYTDEKNIYNKGEVVLFDDFTQDMKYVNFPFMVKSSALKILTEKNSNLFFMFNLLSNINLINEGHKRHYISVVQNTKVTVPSIEEQQKIGNFFKNLDSKIETEKKLLESYKMMKKSLLQKMFV